MGNHSIPRWFHRAGALLARQPILPAPDLLVSQHLHYPLVHGLVVRGY